MSELLQSQEDDSEDVFILIHTWRKSEIFQ